MFHVRSALFAICLAGMVILPGTVSAMPIGLSDLIHLYTIDLQMAGAPKEIINGNAEGATVDPDGNLWIIGHSSTDVGYLFHLDPTEGSSMFLSTPLTTGAKIDGEGVAYETVTDRLLFTETSGAGRVDQKGITATTGTPIVTAGPFDCTGPGVPCREPEGLAFDAARNSLWVVDEHEQIFLEAALDAVAGSVFDLSSLGLGGPEGITLFNDNLLIVFDDDDGGENNNPTIVEYAKDGTKQPFEILVRDLDLLPSFVKHPDPEGIAWDPDAQRLYVVDSDNLQIYILGLVPEPSAATLFAIQTVVVVSVLRKRRFLA